MKATAALTLLLALATLPLAAKPTTPRTATQRAAEEADANGPLSQSVWGICAVNAKGDTLAWLNASRRMVPASNMKLITTGAALLTFGGDYTYKTRFATDGEVQDSVLIGNLYIVGGGDPMIGNLFSYLPSTEVTFRSWFKVLRSNGIKHITGDIVGDGSYFDAIQRHTDWSVEDVATRDGVVPSGLTWRGKMKDTIPDGPAGLPPVEKASLSRSAAFPRMAPDRLHAHRGRLRQGRHSRQPGDAGRSEIQAPEEPCPHSQLPVRQFHSGNTRQEHRNALRGRR